MLGGVLMLILGIWLILQATAGQLAARLLALGKVNPAAGQGGPLFGTQTPGGAVGTGGGGGGGGAW